MGVPFSRGKQQGIAVVNAVVIAVVNAVVNAVELVPKLKFVYYRIERTFVTQTPLHVSVPALRRKYLIASQRLCIVLLV